MVANSPFHPPYALMIGEAISSLKEEGGSTESSISEYIKANFDGLPVAHHRLLPYYLHKLTVQGEFRRCPGGRFLVAADNGDEADAEAEAEPPSAKSRVFESNADGLALHMFDEMTMDDWYDEIYGADPVIDDDAAHLSPTAAGEDEGLKSIPKRKGRGRPRKSLDVDGAKKAVALARTEPVTGKIVVYMKSSPKRRGRPPKRNGDDAEHDDDDESKLVAKRCGMPPKGRRKSKKGSDDGDVEQEINGDGDADKSKKVPKRRGRPPKIKDSSKDAIDCERDGDTPKRRRKSEKISNQNEDIELLKTKSCDGDGLAIVLAEPVGHNVDFPKRRGRRPKSKPTDPVVYEEGGDSVKENPKDGSIDAPKRRGRPPKRKHEFTDSSKDAMFGGGDGNTPKRRRISKKISNQTEDIESLKAKTSDGDGLAIVLAEPVGLKVDSPKRRGRPPKIKPTDPLISEEGDASLREKQTDESIDVPKRLGRPPKRKHENATNEGDVEPSPKRRKLKKNSNQCTNDESLKTKISGEDGSSIVGAEPMTPEVDLHKRRGRPPKSKPVLA